MRKGNCRSKGSDENAHVTSHVRLEAPQDESGPPALRHRTNAASKTGGLTLRIYCLSRPVKCVQRSHPSYLKSPIGPKARYVCSQSEERLYGHKWWVSPCNLVSRVKVDLLLVLTFHCNITADDDDEEASEPSETDWAFKCSLKTAKVRNKLLLVHCNVEILSTTV